MEFDTKLLKNNLIATNTKISQQTQRKIFANLAKKP